MEESDQKKYLKCKYKVKKWESEFKNTHGANPSKTDIKNAPTHIKDAYRTYWKLKTLSLETSLVEVSFGDEDSMDIGSIFSAVNTCEGTNKFALNSEVESESGSIDVPVHSNVGEYEANVDDKPCNLNSLNINEDDTGTQVKLEEKERNETSIWGAHLSNASKNVEKKLNTPKTDISFRFTAKLFPGATFKKRNPRKALIRREKSADITSVSPLEDGEQPLESDVGQKGAEGETTSFENNTVLNKEFSKTEIGSQGFNNFKFKIVSDSQPSKPCQPVSLLHKTLVSNTSTKPLGSRIVDKGWLERLDKVTNIPLCKVNSSDSGIDLTDTSVLEPRSSPLQGNQLEITSDDEDLVCDSGSDEERSKSFSSNCSFKKSFSFSKVPNGFSSNFKRASLSFTALSSIEDGQHKQKAEKRAVESELDDRGIDCALTENRPNKKLKVDIDSSSVKHSIIKDVIFETQYSPVEKTTTKTLEQKSDTSINRFVEIQNKFKTAKEIKLQEILKSKVSSGKLNENFVKINIKKKNYVRGKKTMTFQKYKKQKWKEMKKNQSVNERGVLKCFKCGDVGHFSKNCLKACDQLLPVEDLNEVEESPFPSLQEAEEMALEASKSLCVRRNLISLPTHVTSEITGTDENCIPPPIDNDDIMRFVNHEPVFKLNEDGSLIDTPLAVLNALMECGHDSFRPGQEVAIMRVLSGLSTLVTLSTGSGKSLCYQLPAYLYHTLQQRITLVISPLVSLMEDQVFGIAPCLRVACLHTNQTPQMRAAVFEQLRANTLHALLVSPEALSEADRVGELLRSMPPVAFACIDEAHCISQWSHNFRPSYLTICQVLSEKFGVKTFLGLTATATMATIASVSEALGLPDGLNGVVRDTPLPDNLLLTVSRDPSKDQALVRLLQGRRFSECRSIIIYCTRRDESQRLAAFIRTCLQDVSKEDGKVKRGKISWNAEAYHAGLTAARRRAVQKAFMSGRTRIVVATVAFGMGINKQDIQGIIHYNMPSAFERYVQEVGRAGRDGNIAHCHLFLDTDGKDLSELRRHVYSDSVERHTIRRLLQRVFVPCKCGKVCPGHEVALSLDETIEALDLPEEHISTLLCYLQLDRRGWLKVCPRAYTRCRVLCYKGAATLRRALKECPPLAVAIAQQAQTGVDMKRATNLDFSVFSVAAVINWDSGVVKQQLKKLEWTKVNGNPCRSGITVQLYELGMRLISPGNLSPEELDFALDTLTSRVEARESQALRQLQAIFDVLMQVSYKTVEECMDEVDKERCEHLKTNIRQYFTEDNFLEKHQLPEVSLINEDQVIGDVRTLVNCYRDVTFTGRAVARIFHGIASPNYPAQQWCRCRFWRTHLHEDFNLLSRLATRELIKMR